MEYLIFILISFGCAIVAGFIGWLWYTKLFSKVYTAEVSSKSTSKKAKKNMVRAMLVGLVWDFVTNAVFLILLISFRNANPFVLAGFIWIGFIAPQVAAACIYEGRSWKIFWVTSGYRLVSLVPMSLVFYFLSK